MVHENRLRLPQLLIPGKVTHEVFMVHLQPYLSRHLAREADTLNAFEGILSGLLGGPGQHFWGIPCVFFNEIVFWHNKARTSGERRPEVPSWSWTGRNLQGELEIITRLRHDGIHAKDLATTLPNFHKCNPDHVVQGVQKNGNRSSQANRQPKGAESLSDQDKKEIQTLSQSSSSPELKRMIFFRTSTLETKDLHGFLTAEYFQSKTTRPVHIAQYPIGLLQLQASIS
ncbi:hypothetical protein MKZ38_005542 [Zalerion maritima]|uniref:Uncharacterized protein n=1 Tax=Zalerion maritima TaxID=339359 RepID=A0AAD5RQS3_9PEZI|nr:hypothetical protein MKZ38_005542 [Zalerion maritima]